VRSDDFTWRAPVNRRHVTMRGPPRGSVGTQIGRQRKNRYPSETGRELVDDRQTMRQLCIQADVDQHRYVYVLAESRDGQENIDVLNLTITTALLATISRKFSIDVMDWTISFRREISRRCYGGFYEGFYRRSRGSERASRGEAGSSQISISVNAIAMRPTASLQRRERDRRTK
jgi:hypothetical protein